MDASSPRNHSGRSSRGLWYAALLLAVVGLGFAAELTRIHLRLQSEPTHRSFCNLSATVNCDTVAASTYSMLLGLPLSVWGIFAYVAVVVAAVWGLRANSRPAAAVVWLLSVVCVFGAVGLAAISAFVLRVWCLFCMGTWVVDVGLFVVATRLTKNDGAKSAVLDLLDWLRDNVTKALSVAVAGAIALGVGYRSYGHSGAVLAQPVHAAIVSSGALGQSGKPFEGVDETGQHYVGAKSPKLVITAFSDYQCPHCSLAHQQLSALVTAYPNAIRIVHRHFPLDNDCNPKITHVFHTHACYFARLAICAATLDRFWQGNDFLFAHGREESPVSPERFARAIEAPAASIKDCLASKANAILKRDVELGMSFDLEGTPTFIIEGEKYDGELPVEVLQRYPL